MSTSQAPDISGRWSPAPASPIAITESSWTWPIPMLARNVATKPELEASFDPRFPDFRVDYPDQLRVDEFLNEFNSFVQARASRQGNELPQFVILRLPDDHTAG